MPTRADELALQDLLFTTALDDATLLADAQRVPGLDVAAGQARRRPPPVWLADVALGTNLGISATPTFVINGVEAVPASNLRLVIYRARTQRGERDPAGRALRPSRARALRRRD